MEVWVWLGYLAGSLVAARIAAVFVLRETGDRDDAMMAAFCIAVLWPFVVVLAVLYGVGRLVTARIWVPSHAEEDPPARYHTRKDDLNGLPWEDDE